MFVLSRIALLTREFQAQRHEAKLQRNSMNCTQLLLENSEASDQPAHPQISEFAQCAILAAKDQKSLHADYI